MGFTQPTPVQKEAIPPAFKGRDIVATAQTGTGKTGAFAIPLLARILEGSKRPVLILAPTRELAEQISQVIKDLTRPSPEIRHALIIGGSSYGRQARDLSQHPMFVIGTPGRLLDQVQLGNLQLSTFGALVIDEADRLLDMGFEKQLEDIIRKLPKDRQTMMFTATLAPEIQKLTERYLKDPVSIQIGAANKPIDAIDQDILMISAAEKPHHLIREIDKVAGSLIVFTKTKDRADRVALLLEQAGHEVAALHGDLSQRQRRVAIEGLRSGRYRILVATDIAARGIDVPHIRHVVNYDLPMSPEDYVHRIGRTGRAGAKGHSIAFVTPEDAHLWRRIYKLMYGKNPEGMYDPVPSRGGKKSGKKKSTSRTQPSRGKPARKSSQGKPSRSKAGQRPSRKAAPARGKKGPARKRR